MKIITILSGKGGVGKIYKHWIIDINNLSPRCYPQGYAGFYIFLRGFK